MYSCNFAVPVVWDKDGVLDSVSCVLILEGVHQVCADGPIWVSFPDEQGPVEAVVPCRDDDGVQEGWSVAGVGSGRSAAAEAVRNRRISRVSTEDVNVIGGPPSTDEAMWALCAEAFAEETRR